MVKKKENRSTITRSLITVFLAILSLLVIVGMIFLANDHIAIRNELKSINASLSDDRMQEISSISKNEYYDTYIKLSEKSEQEMDRLVSTVGILATVYTIFGALVVFKAPHEIDKRIDKIDSLVSEINNSALEASYQAEIIDAVANGYNGNLTNYDKLRRLSAVIEKYPDRPDAYMERGFIYDEMKRYDDAIENYKIGLKKGANKSSYYNAMGIAYNKKGSYKKAISFYTRAIDTTKENDDASLYANRGSCYDDIHDYESAIADYCKAIEIDEGCKEAYINRSITLEKQFKSETDEEQKEELYNEIIADLQKAIELDPDDETARRLLRRIVKPNYDPDAMIAKIDEKIGDLEVEGNNYSSAFKQYIESCNYYMIKQLKGDSDYLTDIERVVEKIFSINLDRVSSEASTNSKEMATFCQYLRSISYMFYISGNKELAEKGFIILTKCDSGDRTSLLNLSYMKRRKETKILKAELSELLLQCEMPSDAMWCTNKALCYVSGVENHEVSWQKAVEIMDGSSDNIDEAIEWWENADIVGAPEHNMAMILFNVSKSFLVQDDVPLVQRIKAALADGYIIPKDIAE